MSAASVRVGIVIPTLGVRPDWLFDAVVSVEQQGDNVDLVIAAPPEKIPAIEEQFPGRRVIGETEAGIVPAIEAGWEALDGCEVLAWLGDDDQLTPNSVSTALRVLMSRQKTAMVFGDYEYVDASGKHVATVRPGRSAPLWLRIGQNFIAQPGCLYKRAAVVGTGGLSKTLTLAFDVGLHLNLSPDAVYCRATLAKVRLHASRLTTAQWAQSQRELHAAVWGRAQHRFGARALARCEPLWRLSGRVNYRFRRSY